MAIKAKITVDNSELKKGLKDTENQAKKSMDIIKDVAGSASKGFGNLSSILTKLGGKFAIIAAVIYAAYKVVKAWVGYVDKLLYKMNDMAKAAKAVNMTAEGYQEVSFAARRSGIGIEQVNNIITKLTLTFTKAAEGTKTTIDAFTELGISWSELEKLSPEMQLLSILHSLKQINDVTKRTKILTDLGFGRRDIQTFNKMINNDFGRLTAAASVVGVTFSEDEMRAAEAYADKIETASEQLEAFVAKLKVFKETKTLLEEFKAEFKEFILNEVIDSTGKVSKAYKDMFTGIGDEAEKLYKEYKEHDKKRFEYLQSLYTDAYGNIDAKLARDVWFREVTYKDPRFDIYDRSSWVQEKKDAGGSQFDEEKRKADQIDGAIKRINLALDTKQKKHKDHIASLEKELTLETLIKKVREEAGLKDKDILDPAYIEQIRNLYNELKKLEHIDIKITIDAQTEKLRLMHEIEMAMLNGDKERARVLRTILKLQEAGIEATEDEVINSETNVEDAQRQVDHLTSSRDLFTPEHERYTRYQEEYNDAVAEAEKYYRLVFEYKKKFDELNDSTARKLNPNAVNEGQYYVEQAKEAARLEQEAIRRAQMWQRAMENLEPEEGLYQRKSKELAEAQTSLGRAQTIKAAGDQVNEEDRQDAERKQKTLEQHTKELERQNEITQAEIAGDWERANLLKLLNELKQMGIDIDEEELKKNEEKYQALKKQIAEQRRLNLARNVTDKENSLLIQAMKRVGLTKEAAYYEAILNAEKVKGAKLDYWEEQHIKNLVDIEMELNDPSNRLDLSGMDTKTNELTARGGFASGAVTTPLETINSQIRDYAKRQAELLDKINNEIANGSVI